jgi:hypothetical protein
MHSADFDPDCDAALDEGRHATRFLKEPGVDSAVVWQRPGEELLVAVHDESLGGICLVIPDGYGYRTGSVATIVYHCDVLEATVRHVDPQGDRTSLVGFECHTLVDAARHDARLVDEARAVAALVAARH